ncbi:MAG: TolC family protein, partial [Casimicrobiaceae bacterium]
RRPDLAAAQAQVDAAAAGVRAARAAGMPTISVSANINYNDTSIAPAFNTQAVGILVNIPLFSGFATTYRVRAAQAQLGSQRALRDSVNSQVALDVWQSYYSLQTGTQAVRSAADLVASAEASERLVLGRYKAGVGTILDTLTAQSSLASARLQNIQAQYSWYVLRATLAQALGQLDSATAASPDRQP